VLRRKKKEKKEKEGKKEKEKWCNGLKRPKHPCKKLFHR
jgi:hypothetical protein